MKLWHWLALGIGAYLAFALSSFPAGTAYAWFAPAGLQLEGLEGTLWSGRAAAGKREAEQSQPGDGVRPCEWEPGVIRG